MNARKPTFVQKVIVVYFLESQRNRPFSLSQSIVNFAFYSTLAFL
jgi:hypothetical protein